MDRLKADQPLVTDHPSRPLDAPDEDVGVPPRATLPITPFSDAKPYPGAVLDPGLEPLPDDADENAPEPD
jgi:hypothetical protein